MFQDAERNYNDYNCSLPTQNKNYYDEGEDEFYERQNIRQDMIDLNNQKYPNEDFNKLKSDYSSNQDSANSAHLNKTLLHAAGTLAPQVNLQMGNDFNLVSNFAKRTFSKERAVTDNSNSLEIQNYQNKDKNEDFQNQNVYYSQQREFLNLKKNQENEQQYLRYNDVADFLQNSQLSAIMPLSYQVGSLSDHKFQNNIFQIPQNKYQTNQLSDQNTEQWQSSFQKQEIIHQINNQIVTLRDDSFKDFQAAEVKIRNNEGTKKYLTSNDLNSSQKLVSNYGTANFNQIIASANQSTEQQYLRKNDLYQNQQNVLGKTQNIKKFEPILAEDFRQTPSLPNIQQLPSQEYPYYKFSNTEDYNNQFDEAQNQLSHSLYYQQNNKNMPFSDTKQLSQGSSGNKEFLTITIEIGNGQNEIIRIKDGDSPKILARNFAIKHGINDQLTDLLAEQIRMNIESVLELRENSSRTSGRLMNTNDTNSARKQDNKYQNYIPSTTQQVMNHFSKQSDKLPSSGQPNSQVLSQRIKYEEKQDEIGSLTSLNSEQFINQRIKNYDNQITNKFGQVLVSDKHSVAQSNLKQNDQILHEYYPSLDSENNLRFNNEPQQNHHLVMKQQHFRNVQNDQNQIYYNPKEVNDDNYKNDFIQLDFLRTNPENRNLNNSQQFDEQIQSDQNYQFGQTYQMQGDEAIKMQQFQVEEDYPKKRQVIQSQSTNAESNQYLPQINEKSDQIMKIKREGSFDRVQSSLSQKSNLNNNMNVYERLHSAAITKQKQFLRTLESSDSGAIRIPSNQSNKDRWRSAAEDNNREGVNRGLEFPGTQFNVRQNPSFLPPKGQIAMMREQSLKNSVGNRVSKQSRERPSSVNSQKQRGIFSPPENQPKQIHSQRMSNESNKEQNYGEQLYERGMRRREELRRLVTIAKEEHAKIELQGASFKPKINPISQLLTRSADKRPEEFLIRYGEAVKQKIESRRIESLRKEVEGLDFQPKTLLKSDKILKQKLKKSQSQQNSDRVINKKLEKFDSLYQDAQRRLERQDFIYSQCIEAECTFQPDIEKTRFYNAKAQSLRSQNSQRVLKKQSVFERLSQRLGGSTKERSRICMENSRSLTNELHDPETGQILFQPKVGRAPRGRQRSKAEVGDILYQQGLQKLERDHLKLMEKEFKVSKEQNKVYTDKKTNTIIERQKTNSFSQIFNLLDSDCDGAISAFKININLLEPALLQILTPLLVEMEDLGMSLDRQDFIEAAGRLYNTLSLPDKQILIQRRNKVRSNSVKMKSNENIQSGTFSIGNTNQTPTFKPQINKQSRKIAESRSDGTEVATRLLDKQKEYDRRMQERQNRRENNELLGCTFHPKTLNSPLYSSQALTQFPSSNFKQSLKSTQGFQTRNFDEPNSIRNQSIQREIFSQRAVPSTDITSPQVNFNYQRQQQFVPVQKILKDEPLNGQQQNNGISESAKLKRLAEEVVIDFFSGGQTIGQTTVNNSNPVSGENSQNQHYNNPNHQERQTTYILPLQHKQYQQQFHPNVFNRPPMYPQLKQLFEKENKDDQNFQNIQTPSSQNLKIEKGTISKATNSTELNALGSKDITNQITHPDLPQGGTFELLPRQLETNVRIITSQSQKDFNPQQNNDCTKMRYPNILTVNNQYLMSAPEGFIPYSEYQKRGSQERTEQLSSYGNGSVGTTTNPTIDQRVQTGGSVLLPQIFSSQSTIGQNSVINQLNRIGVQEQKPHRLLFAQFQS